MTPLRPCHARRRQCVVAIAVILTYASIIHPAAVAAYSFVSSGQRCKLQNNNIKSCDYDRSPPSVKRQTSAPFVLAMKGSRHRRQSDDSISKTQLKPVEIAPNLKRHVVAKRPTLGHVVPKNSKTRQFRPTSERGGSDKAQLRPQGKSRDSQRYNNPSNLRILGGSVRGRKLESPNVYLRPMMGKVREAVYSTFGSFGLYDDVGETRCRTRHLDIFSGSGSVGLESLSRGAWHCTFVDMSPDCCHACERNIEKCGFDSWNDGGLGTGIPDEGESAARVVCADAFQALREPETVGIAPGAKFDIVTLCPPYEEIVYAELLEAVANSALVAEDTIVLVEYPVELGCLPHVIGREDGGVLVGIRNRKYGRTVSHFHCLLILCS